MSNSIDQRIVEMQFDNASFEQGVSTTLSSLKKLGDKLSLADGTEGLQKVEDAINGMDFSSMDRSLSTISERFSALGAVAFTAIQRITNAAMDLGKNVLKGALIDPLTDGMEEYNLKLNSIKTIQANTGLSDTEGMKKINATLKELNDYADLTIYNFAEMTRNIGTFTAAGVGLEDSAIAIKGIANLAAASGSNSAQASTAMYQLSQALASGTVKLMDWNSVVNAGMGGQLFQKQLQATSEALGTGAQAAIDAQGSFRESLTEGWLTSEVLIKTLRNFTLADDETNRAMLAQEGYTAEQIEQIFKTAKLAEAAATKVKSFAQLIDTTKEALGSGWATTWEYVLGNIEQAETLFTSISETLGGVIDALSDARNQFFKEWNEGDEKQGIASGWWSLYDALSAFAGLVGDILRPIGEAFSLVFSPLSGLEAAKATANLKEFAEALRRSFNESATGKAILIGLRTAFFLLFTAIKTVLMLVSGVIRTVFSLIGGALTIITGIIEGVVSTIGVLLRPVEAVFNGIQRAIFGVVNALSGFADWLGPLKVIIRTLPAALTGNEEAMAALSNAFEMLDKAYDGLLSGIGDGIAKVAGAIGSFFASGGKNLAGAFDAIGSALAQLGPWLAPIAEQIASVWGPLLDGLSTKAREFGVSVLEGLSNGFQQFGEWLSSVTGIEEISVSLEGLREGFSSLISAIQGNGDILESISSFFSGLQPVFGGILTAIGGGLVWLAQGIGAVLSAGGEKLAEVFEYLGSVWEDVLPHLDEAARTVFSEGAKGLSAMTVAVGDFISVLKDSVFENASAVFGRIGEVLGGAWQKIVPVLSSVKDKLVSLWSVITEAVSSSGLSFEPITNMFSEFGNAFSEFIDNVSNNGISFDSVVNLITGLKDAIVTAFGDIAGPITSIASSIGSHIYDSMSPAIQKLWDLLSSFVNDNLISGLGNIDIFGSLGEMLNKQISDFASFDFSSFDFLGPISDVFNAITHPFSTLADGLSGIFDDIGSAIDKLASSIDSEKLGQIVSGIGQLAALGGIAATFYESMKVLESASGLMDSIGGMFDSVTGIAEAISDAASTMSKAAATKLKTQAIKDVAIAIAIVVGAFIALSFSDLNKVYAAVPLVLGIVAGIVAVVIALNKIPMTTAAEVKALTNVTTSMFALALVIGAVSFAVHTMRGMSSGDIVNASIILLSVGFLIRSMGALSKESKGKVSGGGLATLGKNVLQAAIGVLAIVAAVKILGDMDPAALKQGGDALGSIAILVGALMAFAAWSNKSGGLTKSVPAIVALCGSLTILSVAVRLLATAPFDALMGGVRALGLLMGALVLFIFVMDSINPVILTQDAAALVVMAAAILILAGAVAALAAVDAMGGDIVTGALAIALLVAILAAGLYIMSSAAAQMTVTASAILWFAAAVAILAAVVVVFSLMGDQLWDGIMQMAAALAILVVAFAIVAVVAEICQVGLVAITLFVVGLGVSALLLAVALKIMVDALVEMANIAPEAADQFIEALNRLALGLWESKENIALGIAGLGSGIIAGIITIIPAACEALILLVAKLIETLVRLAPALAMGAMELATGFFNGMAVAIREQGPALIEAIINLFSAIADLAIQALTDGLVSFSNWLYEVTSGAMGTAPKAEEAGEAIGTAMVDGTDSSMSKLPDIVSKNAGAALDKMSEIYPQLETAGSRSGDSFVSGWTNSIFSTFSTNLNSALENAGLNSILPAEWAGETSADAYSSGFASGDISPAAQEMLSKAGFDMNALSSQMGFDSFESYAGGFNESASSVQISDALMEEIDSGDMTAKFEQAGVDAATGFNDGFHGSLQSGDGGFIGETVSSLNQPDMFTQAGMADGVAVTNGLRTGLFQAAGNARTALNNVSSAVSSYSGTMGSSGRWIGYNVSAGISRGIDEGAWMAIARARAVAERVTRTIKDALNERSPSRVMMEIGEYVSEGLAIGISNAANMPVSAAESMARNTISAVSKQVSMIEAMAEDISADPVIRPVLDLSDYNAGLSAMGALDASPTFAASGWTSGIRTPYDLRTPISSRNTSNTIQVTLDWKAGTTPNQVVQELAEELGAYYAMEG